MFRRRMAPAHTYTAFPGSTIQFRGKAVVSLRGGKWGWSEYLLAVGGLCTLLGTVLVAWKYDKFNAVWSAWQESEHRTEVPGKWHDHVVNIIILKGAVSKGAVCLDGSPPAYFLDRGSGDGVNNWIVFLEGGGWCPSDETCLERAFTELGSSRYMPRKVHLTGILSSSPSVNPDFYNWNRVKVKYCDGGSFNGDVSEARLVEFGPNSRHPKDGKTHNIFYRGQRIWTAVIEDLLDKGMKNAKKAFLGGCSAGGLASILHCDQYRELMPKETSVKCMSDAGFFIDVPDVSGAQTIEAFYKKVVLLQNMVGNLPKVCTSQRDETQCIFPQYLVGNIETPLFMLNPAYDTWQFDNVLIPVTADPEKSWDNCKRDLAYCSDIELEVVQGFRDDLLKGLQPLIEDEKHGAFIDSCYIHCQSEADSTWSGKQCPKVGHKSIAQVVADWYLERNLSKVIDCAFPCNPTCG